MPNFDGTGPVRKGPMTGQGKGYCILRIPDKHDAPITGSVGAAGRGYGGIFGWGTKEAMAMPRGDRTGPSGLGPITGRRAGFCGGYQTPGHSNRSSQDDFGQKEPEVGGFGHRNRFYATGIAGWQRAGVEYPGTRGSMIQEMSPVATSTGEAAEKEQLNMLKAHARHMANMLEGMKKRIQKLESESEAE